MLKAKTQVCRGQLSYMDPPVQHLLGNDNKLESLGRRKTELGSCKCWSRKFVVPVRVVGVGAITGGNRNPSRDFAAS